MYQLSEEQITWVEQKIGQGGNNKLLRDDLLDHFCCFIEEAMDNGKDITTAYDDAYKAITPDGVADIETELFLLLNFNKQIGMKRLLYGFGFLAAFLLSVGFTFKIMAWPGASVTLFTGFASLAVSVLVLLINAMRNASNHPAAYNARLVIGVLAGVLISTGSMFKILWYPGANIMMVLGMFLFSILFLPMFFYQLYRRAIA